VMQTDHMRDEFATLRIMGRMSVTGIHEAGHAVVGAYLHLPVVSVGLKRGRFSAHDGSMSFRDGVAGRTRVSGRLFSARTLDAVLRRGEYESVVVRKQSDRAAMGLGARAAVELLLPDSVIDERGYATDERNAREIAELLEVSAADFSEWREKQLQRARGIVRIKYVKHTILDVAMDLETALTMGKRGLSGQHVRALLRSQRRSTEAGTGAWTAPGHGQVIDD